jgi:cytochrome c-type biogenesis protein CcmH
MQWVSLKRVRLIAGLFAGVVLLLGAGDDAQRIDRLGHQIMCVCGCNYILLECNHVGCPYSDGMRNQLTSAVTRGDDDSAILHWFVQTYGTVVLLAPTKTGFNRVAWIMPYLALALGIALVVFIVWLWTKRPPSANTGIPVAVRGIELDRFRQQASRETEI